MDQACGNLCAKPPSPCGYSFQRQAGVVCLPGTDDGLRRLTWLVASGEAPILSLIIVLVGTTTTTNPVAALCSRDMIPDEEQLRRLEEAPVREREESLGEGGVSNGKKEGGILEDRRGGVMEDLDTDGGLRAPPSSRNGGAAGVGVGRGGRRDVLRGAAGRNCGTERRTGE